MAEKSKDKENKTNEEEIKTEQMSEIEELQKKFEDECKKTEEYMDSLKRNMAEFDNYKKRIAKEKESLYVNTLSDVIQNLLPIIDNFEKAVAADATDVSYKAGIEMIYKDLMEMLKKYDIEAIPDLGEEFNPEFHEAVMSVIDETKKEKEIVEVFRRGYKLKDKVIRHSLVKVAN